MSVAVSHEEHVFDPQLNKLKDNSPLNPLTCVACIYDHSFMFFLYLSQHLCVFFIFAAAVLPGFRKAIYNGLKRISTGFPSK